MVESLSLYYRMSVNPYLATLMRVIEEAQDKMPEGEYLAAMNALGALHRVVAVAAPVPVAAGPYTLEEQRKIIEVKLCERARTLWRERANARARE